MKKIDITIITGNLYNFFFINLDRDMSIKSTDLFLKNVAYFLYFI